MELSDGNHRRRLRRVAVVAVAVLVSAAALPAAARAHTVLVRSDPPAGARLDSSPARVVLEFSEPYVRGSEHVDVRLGDGKDIALPPHSGSPTVIRQPLPRQLTGLVIVAWRVLSDDGHLSRGEFEFSVGAGETPAPGAASTTPTPWSQVVMNWLFFIGLALALGGLLSEELVWRNGAPHAPAGIGVAVAALSSAALLVLLAGASASGGGFGAGLHAQALRSASEARPGALTLAVVAVLAVAGALLLDSRTREWAILPLAAAAILTSARGHAETTGYWWAPMVDSIHFLAAAAWVGALVHLVLVIVRTPDRAAAGGPAIRRYSRLALPTVAVVLATGLMSALTEVDGVRSVLNSGYGQTLVAKTTLVLLALAVAATARLLALPAGPSRGLPLLRGLTLSESVLVVAVLAAVALLVNLAPPREATAQAREAGQPAAARGPEVLARMLKTMRAGRSVDVTERLAIASRKDGSSTKYRLTGREFIASEAYSTGASDVRLVAGDPNLTELRLIANDAKTSYTLWIDDTFRLRRERVVSPGLSIRRTFAYADSPAVASSPVLEGSIPTGPFVTALENGDQAVALAAQPAGANRLKLTVIVIGPDGDGMSGLRVEVKLLAAAESHGPASPCGPGCYSVTVPLTGTPRAGVVTIKELGHLPSVVRFAFPSSWPPPSAKSIASDATQVFSRLSSLSIDERLGSSPTSITHTLWRLEAPNRLTYSIEDGSRAVIIGSRRWDLDPGQSWAESPQAPVRQPTSTWGSAPRQAALLGSGRVRGREVWWISFVKPDIPAWFKIAVDKKTQRTLELRMIAAAHFMHHVYGGFNDPPTIRPPG